MSGSAKKEEQLCHNRSGNLIFFLLEPISKTLLISLKNVRGDFFYKKNLEGSFFLEKNLGGGDWNGITAHRGNLGQYFTCICIYKCQRAESQAVKRRLRLGYVYSLSASF